MVGTESSELLAEVLLLCLWGPFSLEEISNPGFVGLHRPSIGFRFVELRFGLGVSLHFQIAPQLEQIDVGRSELSVNVRQNPVKDRMNAVTTNGS